MSDKNNKQCNQNINNKQYNQKNKYKKNNDKLLEKILTNINTINNDIKYIKENMLVAQPNENIYDIYLQNNACPECNECKKTSESLSNNNKTSVGNPVKQDQQVDPLTLLFGLMSQMYVPEEKQQVVLKEEEEDETPNNYSSVKIEKIDIKINTIDDLIKLGYLYDELSKQKVKKRKMKKIPKRNGLYELNGKYYPINLELVYKMIEPLNKLKNMIGLVNIKDSILDMILYYLQNFEKKNNNMLHTVIEGSPGVGKTELGKILGEIYAALGIIENNKFKMVKRTDLIGQYLGNTALKTKEVLDEAAGGILFIDEAYSLGSKDGKDSFSKECIDTLNLYLSENKNNLICIIAGYPDELESCFFSQNPGLRRRFPFTYSIEAYSHAEMAKIFLKKINDAKWKLSESIDENYINNFFKDNINNFKNFGGDIDNLIVKCKFSHSRRVVMDHPDKKKIFTDTDLINGFNSFVDKTNTNDMYSYIYS